MEMKQRNLQNVRSWEIASQKARIAEEIVWQYLERLGYIVYRPISEGAHAFDILAVKDKKKVIIAEVKAKARRNYYPDTGINHRHYQEYKAIANKHNLNVFLFFVDEMLEMIYGNWLHILECKCKIKHKGKLIDYPLLEKGIIYFPLSKMIRICDLKVEESEALKSKSQRSYSYGFSEKVTNIPPFLFE